MCGSLFSKAREPGAWQLRALVNAGLKDVSVLTVANVDDGAKGHAPVVHPSQRSDRAGPVRQEARGAGGLPSPTHSPTDPGAWLVVTGQNSACKESPGSVADILGVRFPGEADVVCAAAALTGSSRRSPLRSQIEVSPGSIRFRRTVPPDGGDDMPATEQSGSGRQAITSWTVKSRRQMLRSFAALDYAPMFAEGAIPARVTLTYPGDWLAVAPSGVAVQRHFRILERRFVRAWDEPMVCLWKLEFQHRGAPHFHLWQRRPNGVAGQARKARYDAACIAWQASGRIGPRPRYRPAHGDGLRFGAWLAVTWADIVAHPDPAQRAAHELAGTQVDVKDGLRGTDPKRASTYFSKHGLGKGSKEYQNQVPAEWLDQGEGPGRFWGYLGLHSLIVAAEVDGGRDYQVAKRTMRRWSARTRTWDQDALSVRYVKATRPVRVKRGKRWRTVRRPAGRLGGHSGTLCVNDGPAMAQYLAQVIYLTAEQDRREQEARARPAPRQASTGLSDEVFLCEHCDRRHPLREQRICKARAAMVVRVR